MLGWEILPAVSARVSKTTSLSTSVFVRHTIKFYPPDNLHRNIYAIIRQTMGGETQSERVKERRDGRGVRIFVGINPWGERVRASEREMRDMIERISARRRASAPPSQRRCWVALALLLAPPPRSAALDLGEKVGNGRGRRRARGPDEAGNAVAGQTPSSMRSVARQRASSRLEAGSSTGLNPTGPGVQSSGEISGLVEIASGRGRRRARGDRRGWRCSRQANWGLTA